MKNKEIIKDPSNCREQPAEERRAGGDEGDIKENNMERDDRDYVNSSVHSDLIIYYWP